MIDHVLIVGFGGPTKPDEIMPFLRQVSKGRNIPEARLESVAHHYERIGGYSPYNEFTFELERAIKAKMEESGIDLPVFVGMRNWNPFLSETLSEIKARNLKRGIGVILSAFRSKNSCDQYKQNVSDAQKEVNAEDIEYEYLPGWGHHPSFIEAAADELQKTISSVVETDANGVPVIFTAHSIPNSMLELCSKCNYEDEFNKAAELIAKRVGHKNWHIAYQSRSGRPSDPWLSPEVGEVVRKLGADGVPAVIIAPIGFFCDNAEVLFDLDIEVAALAEEVGIEYYRSNTVVAHPKFVSMFVDLIQEVTSKYTPT